MIYWYRLSENYDRECAKRMGETPKPITLYPDSTEIREEFYKHGGWSMLGDFCDYADLKQCQFDSIEDAERFFYLSWDGTREEVKAFYDKLKAEG